MRPRSGLSPALIIVVLVVIGAATLFATGNLPGSGAGSVPSGSLSAALSTQGTANASLSPGSTSALTSGEPAPSTPTGSIGPNATPAPGSTPVTPGRTPDPTASPKPSPTPTGPVVTPSPRPLPDYVSNGSPKKKWIALSLDADMYPFMYAKRKQVPEVDMRIINLLESTNTPATIFLNGLWVKAYPDIVKRLAKDPNIELANHSWDHAGWTSNCTNTTPIQPPMTQRTEVTTVADLVKQLTGIKLKYFRFPGGCHTPSQARLVRSLGETGVGWTCYFGDTFLWSAAKQVASVENGCGRGSIVITHINGPPYHPNIYEALKQLIPWWKQHGWTVVNVGTMLGHPTPKP